MRSLNDEIDASVPIPGTRQNEEREREKKG